MLSRFSLLLALLSAFFLLPLSPTLALSESQQDAAIAALQSAVASLQSTVSSQQSMINSQASKITSLQSQVNSLKSVTSGFSRVTDTTRTDGKKGTELYLTGFNLHVVNGLGATDGRPDGTGTAQVNGLGNLIVGYNDLRGDGNNVRTGSHNIVVGVGANYTSYGGLVAGVLNTISGSYATVAGGVGNTASGDFSSVSGGTGNTAGGSQSSIAGGLYLLENSTYGFAAGGQYTQPAPGSGVFHSP